MLTAPAILNLPAVIVHAILDLAPHRTVALRSASKRAQMLVKEAAAAVVVVSPKFPRLEDAAKCVQLLYSFRHSVHLYFRYDTSDVRRWVSAFCASVREEARNKPKLTLLSFHYHNNSSPEPYVFAYTPVDCSAVSILMGNMNIGPLQRFGMFTHGRESVEDAVGDTQATRRGEFKLYWSDETPMQMPALSGLQALRVLDCATIDGLASCMGLREGLPLLEELYLGPIDTKSLVSAGDSCFDPLRQLRVLSVSDPPAREFERKQILRLLTSDSLPRLERLAITEIDEGWALHLHELLLTVFRLRSLKSLLLDECESTWVSSLEEGEFTRLSYGALGVAPDFACDHLDIAAFDAWLPSTLRPPGGYTKSAVTWPHLKHHECPWLLECFKRG